MSPLTVLMTTEAMSGGSACATPNVQAGIAARSSRRLIGSQAIN
jgi:hypothetical protein